jgi:glycosyltransferase involved in cell wall biosynthesis
MYLTDNKENSIGWKRNTLMNLSEGQYLAFIDSDDRIGPNYFKRILEGIDIGVDCCSLRGIITEDGVNPLVFEHSIKYHEYKTNPEGTPVRYERFPNHLNSIRSEIAKQFKFPEINHGEDTDFATQIHRSGLIKSEYYIDEIIYHYDWISKK